MRLVSLLRAAFWKLAGPPPRPRVDVAGIIRSMNAATESRSFPAFEFSVSPPDPMVEAEHIRELARVYEQRTGRPLFGPVN